MSDLVPDADDADRQEQSAPVEDAAGGVDRPSSDLEAPEADALEQAQAEPVTDDYDR